MLVFRVNFRQESSNLDLLRSIAVLTVYAFHLALATGSKPDNEMGRFGVILFFVHTSIVLMMSLGRMERRKEPLFSDFYLRRIFRIYPLSIVCVAATLAFHLPHAPWWPWSQPGPGTMAANFLLCMNVLYLEPVTSVLWSLPYEVQMYLFLPALYLIGRAKGWRGISILWVLSIAAALIQPHISGRLDLAKFGPCFLSGVLAYFISFEVKGRLHRVWWPFAIAGAASILALFTALHLPVVGSWVMCLALGIVYPLVQEAKISWLNAITHWIAKYSYGIYLTHLYAQWVAFVVLRSAPVFYRISALVLLSVLLPMLCFHLVENPMNRLGMRLTRRHSNKADVQPILPAPQDTMPENVYAESKAG